MLSFAENFTIFGLITEETKYLPEFEVVIH